MQREAEHTGNLCHEPVAWCPTTCHWRLGWGKPPCKGQPPLWRPCRWHHHLRSRPVEVWLACKSCSGGRLWLGLLWIQVSCPRLLSSRSAFTLFYTWHNAQWQCLAYCQALWVDRLTQRLAHIAGDHIHVFIIQIFNANYAHFQNLHIRPRTAVASLPKRK